MTPISFPTDGPELFIGLAAAVGTDLDLVIGKLSKELRRVGYQPIHIKLSSLLKELPEYAHHLVFTPADQYIASHMTQGDELRRRTGQNDALALLALGEIRKLREERGSPERPLSRHAYILRSLKHPDEVTTLRNVYGKSFY